MVRKVKLAFRPDVIEVAIDDILPVKIIKASIKKSAKYRQVMTSIREVGLIEHLVVYNQKGLAGKYLMLDGHLRLDVLKALGATTVHCLVATDDEGYTYNHKISRLSPIQEHFMILAAVEKGVSEERIAKALDVDVGEIRRKRNLLKGIDPAAVELLKDKRISPTALRYLSRVTPARQVEMCELMVAAHTYTVPFARALFTATPPGQRHADLKKKRLPEMSPQQMARMEKETEVLARDIELVRESYGKDTLNLVLACGYLARLFENDKVVGFLSSHYPDILAEFQKIVRASSMASAPS